MRANLTVALLGVLCVVGCGGGGGGSAGGGGNTTPTGSNVQALVVDSGPQAVATSGSPAVNTLYTSVMICVPGTTTCQTIDHIQVDTGSSGLRLLNSVLTLSLPQQKDASGNAIAECTQFVDGSSWGTLRLADIKISGEVASNLAVQVIGDAAYAIPGTCTGKAENKVTDFGANGILGVGPFVQDCGASCAAHVSNVYYTCAGTNPCAESAMPLTLQIKNPVTAFTTDNNGVLIQVGTVNGTAASATGSLIFGIGTQSNNGLGSAKVYTLDDVGSLTTTYKGSSLTKSFIDSGSNAYYFPDSSIGTCASSTTAPGFYCPSSTLSLTATIMGVNGTSSTINFSVANADNLFKSGGTVAAASTLAAPSTSINNTGGSNFDGTLTFDWGLPFYFGRSVYTAIESQNTSAGMGPYFAF